MKITELLMATQKEIPNDAQIASHKLMIRAGLIARLASGLYSYLPIGLMVLRKIEKVVREEMNKSGAQELLMPMTQPAELWKTSKRWQEYGPELLRFQDRHKHDFCLGPTHEEVITNLASRYIRSYKQLPINLYQIQTKFRDEIRPRFGIIRAREFIMKDAYSFHLDSTSLQETYDVMRQTYCNIFKRLKLDYRIVLADSGAIGGNKSHEFHVLTESGEDIICFSDSSNYAANIEHAQTLPVSNAATLNQKLQIVETPNKKTIKAVSDFLKISPTKNIKTIIVKSTTGELIAFALRGDHQLNHTKAAKIKDVASPLQMASKFEIKQCLGCSVGSIGVKNLPIKLVVDYAASCLTNFVCGANEDDKHLIGVNWKRDVGPIVTADLRNVISGDPSPDGNGKLIVTHGIEIGHIFQLGTKYSKALKANIINTKGKATPLVMGCYGIGISRIMAASIEQNFDEKGIIFPSAIAPFQLIIVPINYHKSSAVTKLANSLYEQFLKNKVETLLDNRRERAGVMFADSEIIGIPHRIVISDTNIYKGKIEYKARGSNNKIEVELTNIFKFIQTRIS